jgi:hypothetical protein
LQYGEKGRYSDAFLKTNNLIYEPQFKGDIGECYRQEKIKILT